MRGSDEAFVQECLLDPDVPPPPCDWDRLCHLLERIEHAPPEERDALFAVAREVAMENGAAHALIERMKRELAERR